MLSRFEVNVQTGERSEIHQRVYVNSDKDVLVLDDGISPPDGFIEYTANPADLEAPAIE